MTKITQHELVKEFYLKNPNRAIQHQEAVDWLTEEYKKRTGDVFRDPDRAIRKLHQEGFLIKIDKGVYKYDPDQVTNRDLEDFTSQQKKAIFKRDGYKCVICGRGVQEGLEIHADHIKPKDKGGKAEIENGQTLCSEHNFKKKNYSGTETGKKMFMRLHAQAKSLGDQKLTDFCQDILKVYQEHDINGHIEWEFLQAKHQPEMLETMLLSESLLQKDWLKAEEEEAWQDL
jgi:hypothetical protein